MEKMYDETDSRFLYRTGFRYRQQDKWGFDSEKTCRLRQLGGANTIGLPVAGECREGNGIESDNQDGQWKV